VSWHSVTMLSFRPSVLGTLHLSSIASPDGCRFGVAWGDGWLCIVQVSEPGVPAYGRGWAGESPFGGRGRVGGVVGCGVGGGWVWEFGEEVDGGVVVDCAEWGDGGAEFVERAEFGGVGFEFVGVD
jgi:hypothetical protein